MVQGSQNTTSLSVNSVVNKTTCFGLPGYSAATDLMGFYLYSSTSVDDEISTSNRSILWNVLISYI